MSRVTMEDLDWAAAWVASFDPEAPGDPAFEAENTARRDAVVAWIRAEIERRRNKSIEDALVREVARTRGISVEALKKLPNFRSRVNKAMASITSKQD